MILEHGPSHTKDISQAKADLDKFGYCVIPEVLNDTEIEISKKRLLEQAEAEEELGLSFRDGGANQEVKVKNGRVDKDSFIALHDVSTRKSNKSKDSQYMCYTETTLVINTQRRSSYQQSH